MNFIRKHELSIYYLSVYATTGILFFTQAALFPDFPLPLYLLTPAIFALLMTYIVSKKEGLINFIKTFIPQRMKINYLLLSAVIPFSLIFLSDIIFKIITSHTIDYRSSVIPLNIGYFIVIWIGSLGEEIGWRAYLLPKVTKKYAKLISSIIVGLLWVLWHAGDYGQGIGYLVQIVWMLAMAVIMTWLYDKSDNNLLTAVIYHAFFGISGTYVGIEMPLSTAYHLVLALVFGVFALGVALTSNVFKQDYESEIMIKKCPDANCK